jgi:hypothetical protein
MYFGTKEVPIFGVVDKLGMSMGLKFKYIFAFFSFSYKDRTAANFKYLITHSLTYDRQQT